MRRHLLRGVRTSAGWGIGVLVLSLACGEQPAPRSPQRLEIGAGVVRFGEVARRYGPGSESRAVLAPGNPLELELTDAPHGELRLAVALEGAEPGASATCRASLEADDGSETALVEMEAGPSRFETARLALGEDASRRVRLRLRCERPPVGTPVWARPLAVPARRPEACLVVLVSLDTLRADFVSGFGGEPGTTPELERLGDEGIRFQSAASEATWTLPSHYALLRSGVYGFHLERGRPLSLAELLAERGFHTLATTGGGFVGVYFYFDQGFDEFDERWNRVTDLSAQVESAVSEIRESAGIPTFLFFHTYAAHEKAPVEKSWTRDRRGYLRDYLPTPAEVAEIREFYGGLVRQMDRDLGPLFAALRDAAREREVLLVLTSDHGEAFLEHGGFRHGYNAKRQSLHDELTRVPLVVWGPGRIPGGRESSRPVMLSDIAPSLLDAVGLEAPDTMVGRSFWPLWSGAVDELAGPGAFSQTGAFGQTGAVSRTGAVSQTKGSWSLRERRHKLIATTERADGAVDEALELYDLVTDPTESNDLADDDPERAHEMLERLRERLDALGIPTGDRRTLPDCPLCEIKAAGLFLREAMGEEDSGPEAEALRDTLRARTRARLEALGYVE